MFTPSKLNRLIVREKPRNRWAVMHQKWRDLFFIHWECNPQQVQKTLPKGLFVDTFNDKAYVGIVSFKMRDVRPSFVPAVVGLSNFLELNVRTYVYNQRGEPGVWFYSLDTNQKSAVIIARKFFHLPYIFSKMQDRQDKQKLTYQAKREKDDCFFNLELYHQNSYQQAKSGTLDFFLLERYLLFSHNQNKIYTGRVFHHPYLFSNAKVLNLQHNSPCLKQFNFHKTDPMNVMFSPGVDVEIYSIK